MPDAYSYQLNPPYETRLFQSRVRALAFASKQNSGCMSVLFAFDFVFGHYCISSDASEHFV